MLLSEGALLETAKDSLIFHTNKCGFCPKTFHFLQINQPVLIKKSVKSWREMGKYISSEVSSN